MAKIKGNKTLTGSWGEVWVNGEKIWELSKIEQKITANREDVQMGLDVDSTLTARRLTTMKLACPGKMILPLEAASSRKFKILLPAETRITMCTGLRRFSTLEMLSVSPAGTGEER